MINLTPKAMNHGTGLVQPNQSKPSQHQSFQTFASQLVGAHANAAQMQATKQVVPASGRQTDVLRQLSVATPAATATTPAATAPSTPSTQSSSALTGFNALVASQELANAKIASATPATSASGNGTTPASTGTTSSSSGPAPATTMTDDSYWAAQPPAVQQLRSVQDMSQRESMATQLASQGYTVDVPIMVWGWDPVQTTQLRQSFGYTWVPSALQQPVALAPGLTMPGSLQAYDPKNPPAGSISVSA